MSALVGILGLVAGWLLSEVFIIPRLRKCRWWPK